MNDLAKGSVVVTGVSTGIGKACADILIHAGFHIFGSVRTKADAERLQAQWAKSFTPLIFDVTDEAAIASAAALVETNCLATNLVELVNNAGVALPGPLLYQPLDEFRRQIEINLIGQLCVIQSFAPLLGASEKRSGQKGRIVNMSSVAGKFALPFLGAYSASKHALEGLSDALRRELLIYGIDVIIIEPGAIATPIWEKVEGKGLTAYDATIYGPPAWRFKQWASEMSLHGAPPEQVAKKVLSVLTARHPPNRVRVASSSFLDGLLPKILPTRVLDRLVAQRMGLC